MDQPIKEMEDIQHLNGADWELNEEDRPAGLSLSGRKALLDDYPDDETTSKKTKKPKPGNGTQESPESKKREKTKNDCRPMRKRPATKKRNQKQYPHYDTSP